MAYDKELTKAPNADDEGTKVDRKRKVVRGRSRTGAEQVDQPGSKPPTSSAFSFASAQNDCQNLLREGAPQIRTKSSRLSDRHLNFLSTGS